MARSHEDGETSWEATEPPVCFAFSSSSRRLPMILAEICDKSRRQQAENHYVRRRTHVANVDLGPRNAQLQ